MKTKILEITKVSNRIEALLQSDQNALTQEGQKYPVFSENLLMDITTLVNLINNLNPDSFFDTIINDKGEV